MITHKLTKKILRESKPITLYPTDNQFYLKIENINIIGLNDKNEKIIRGYNLAYIQFTKTLKDKSSNFSSKIDLLDYKDVNKGLINTEYNFDYSQIELEFINKTEFDLYLEIEIETVKKLYPRNPYIEFYQHLSKNNNSKILFSSPFGTGKTTFLQDFFENYNNEYEVFHLFPVNYSVATNTDIFEYIKCEILFQLLSKDTEFEKEDFSINLTLPEFAKNNIDSILINFAELIPNIGKDISGILNNLLKLKTKFIKYHKKLQIDDEDVAKKFLSNFYNKKGSIYEDNYITQIIRQLIQQFYSKGKKTILVIDDLDRIDPDHIFRILNVFSAHFDSNTYKALETTNKFGFDKIILVCDYNNIQSIFSHKFGAKTHFEGYINKFYSSDVFHYNNNAAIFFKLKEIEQKSESLFFQIILRDLRELKLISIRDATRINIIDSNLLENYHFENRILKHIEQFIALKTLNNVYNINTMISMFKLCKEKMNIKDDRSYHKLTRDCFIPMTESDISKLNIFNLNSLCLFNGQSYKFKTAFADNNFYEVTEISFGNTVYTREKLNDIPFNSTDFYTMILSIIERYKKYFN